MKKSVDLLLILPLVLVIGYVLVAYQTGALPGLFSAGSPVPTERATEGLTPTALPALLPNSILTSPTLPPPAFTSTQTPTQTSTLTATPIPTDTPTSTSTGTPTSPEIEGGIAIGNGIILAIERYALDQGHYPAALTDLLPAYLPALPVTLTGQPYFYRSFDASHPLAAEGYWLGFRVLEREHLTCTYLRRLAYWDCNYASP